MIIFQIAFIYVLILIVATAHGLDVKNKSPSDFNRLFLEYILKNPSKQLFQCFKDALRHEG